MAEDEFWALIEGTRRGAEGAVGAQSRLLREFFLEKRSTEVLLAFRDRWDEVDERVFTWPIWDAACVLLGYVSDDFFGDVRAWIIGHGRATVNRIASDPDALAELAGDVESLESGEAESLGLLVWRLWEDLTGDADGPPAGERRATALSGSRIDLSDTDAVRRHFPRLAAAAGTPRPGA